MRRQSNDGFQETWSSGVALGLLTAPAASATSVAIGSGASLTEVNRWKEWMLLWQVDTLMDCSCIGDQLSLVADETRERLDE